MEEAGVTSHGKQSVGATEASKTPTRNANCQVVRVPTKCLKTLLDPLNHPFTYPTRNFLLHRHGLAKKMKKLFRFLGILPSHSPAPVNTQAPVAITAPKAVRIPNTSRYSLVPPPPRMCHFEAFIFLAHATFRERHQRPATYPHSTRLSTSWLLRSSSPYSNSSHLQRVEKTYSPS